MATGLAVDEQKRLAAEFAVGLIEPGMVVGLGVGSTAIHAVNRIGRLLREGGLTGIVCIPCSKSTEAAARALGIPLTTLDEHPVVDLTIDGADEVDPEKNLIKGAGGALLREKIVAQASRREVIVVDAGKHSPVLGTRWPVPVEVMAFGCGSQQRYLASIANAATLRIAENGQPYLTDQGNVIIDCTFGPMHDPGAIARLLEGRAGVVEHGLFLGLATDLVTATADGIQHESGRPRNP
ncbi:ribose-5-phosphate isomerase [bacterium SCGC AG-212-C10]|nr:ribose-5-phosphate isomerase [bacterium SCGC AG-212-C10]